MTTANKAPAYQWYPRDHAADELVLLMTLEEEGAYRRLLDHQWLHGSIPADVAQLARICNTTPPRMERIWKAVVPCFVPAEGVGDRLRNRRLERVRTESREYRERQSAAGKQGAEARWGLKRGDGERDGTTDNRGDGERMAGAWPGDSSASASASTPAVDSFSGEASPPPAEAAQQDGAGGEPPALPRPRQEESQYLGTCRKVAWQPDGKPPADWSESRELSVYRQRRMKGDTHDELLQMLHGVRMLIDQGAFSWASLGSGGKFTGRVLNNSRNGARDAGSEALDAYHAQLIRPVRRREHGGVTPIGATLRETRTR